MREATDDDSKEAREALALLERSQAAWVVYRKAECDAIYSWWSGGTIRGTIAQMCLSELANSRTLEIWNQWLHFGDSTPPLMPDPAKVSR